MKNKSKTIPISPRDLISFLVRASLIESAKERLKKCQEELRWLEDDNIKHWKELSKKYGLKKDDKYEIDQDNCLLIISK